MFKLNGNGELKLRLKKCQSRNNGLQHSLKADYLMRKLGELISRDIRLLILGRRNCQQLIKKTVWFYLFNWNLSVVAAKRDTIRGKQICRINFLILPTVRRFAKAFLIKKTESAATSLTLHVDRSHLIKFPDNSYLFIYY